MQHLVSIIIPTYNRAHLLGETLNSILLQTYSNWECIVVDDGSIDETEALLAFFVKKDSRIKFFKRPNTLSKGANVCRNYGLELSQGEFIQFFDSDDLMIPYSLEKRIAKFYETDLDFVVAKLVNFKENGELVEQYYDRSNKSISFSDFLFRKINWLTPDAIVRREILIQNGIRFNESFNSDQEYNFFCKLLLRTIRGEYLDEVLTKRRIHQESIQGQINSDSYEYRKHVFKNWFLNMQDLKPIRSSELYMKYLNQIMTICFTNSGMGIWSEYNRFLFKEVYELKGAKKSMFFIVSIITNYIFKKGFRFLEWSKS